MVEDAVDKFLLFEMRGPVDAHLLGKFDKLNMGFVFQFGDIEHKFSLYGAEAL